MFIGEFEYRIDEKGRVPIPPKFRQEPRGEGVVSTPGIEKSITAYPLDEWKKPGVCNLLARIRSNGLGAERRQLDNKESRGV